MDMNGFASVEMLIIGLRRVVRDTRDETENKALRLFLSQIEDDLKDAGSRLTKLKSKASRPPEGEVVPYGEIET